MTQNNSKKIIAITGGMGSGKTVALKTIEALGYPVFSCDETTAELYKKRWVLKKIKSIFPSAVTGKLILKANKKEIAAAAFSDEEKYQSLITYFTPLIFNETMKKARKEKNTVFVEVPLLFELGYQKYFDEVFVIKRALKERIESIKKRSNLTEKEIRERIEKQFDYDGADLSGYRIINNDGTINQLKEQLKKAIEKSI